ARADRLAVACRLYPSRLVAMTLSIDALAGLTEEQKAIAELAYELGAKYADRRFDDHEASLSQWDDLSASGFTGLSLPEEDGGWRISGEKTFISALESSDAMVLVTGAPESGGLSVFAFELPHEGVTTQRVAVEAPAFEWQWSVFFDDVVLPQDSLLGAPGKG